MNKLPKSLALASLFAPMGVSALGVGEIELYSALNQPFNAEIKLVTSRSETADEIKVNLASPEAFQKAGVERYFYLSDLRFKPEIAADGSISVKVSSRDVIREPFLNFLVEVNWPQGRALKEFTVLLDPPVMLNEAEPIFQTAPVATKSTSAVKKATSTFSGSEFGPTQRNDTLWSVAERVNSDSSLSHEQVMMSLYEKNRQAFYKPNVNALKRGQVLQVPSRDEMLRLTPSEAKRQFSEHYRQWKNGNKASSSGFSASSSPKQKSAETSPDTLIEPSIASEEILSEEQQLTLLTPASDKASDSTGLADLEESVSGSSESSADIAIEIAETARQESADLQERMALMEEKLAAMQRLLVLKDQQLAALQGAGTGEGASEEISPEEKTAQVVATASPEVAAVADAANSPQSEPANNESTFFEDPMVLGAGGIAVLLLALGAIAARRKRALEEETVAAESILVSTDEAAHAPEGLVAPLVESTESDVTAPAESSFLSEFTPSDFDSLDNESDEIDPITEADVYLAYGRYQQAEDLVRQALDSAPDNNEYKLKLLEIYFATEDKNAFVELASDIKTQSEISSPEVWGRVVEMGQDLCPEETMFQTSDAEIAEEESDDTSGGEAAFEQPFAEEIPGDEQVEEISEESLFDEEDKTEAELDSVSEEGEVVEDLSFDLEEEAAVESEENELLLDSEDPQKELDQPEIEENLIDFDVDMESASVRSEDVAPEDTSEPDAPENDEFAFDFEMVSPQENGEAVSSLEQSTTGEVEGDFDLGFDDEVASSLTDMDEVETKLDLAKAYVDMEDGEAAKGILEEVLAQGDENQKAEAKALLDTLG